MIGSTNVASRFNIDKFSQILGLRGMKEVINKRDDFVVNALFCFEPVQKFNYKGDMFSFVGSCYSNRVFAVNEDDIFVLAVSLGKVSYNSII